MKLRILLFLLPLLAFAQVDPEHLTGTTGNVQTNINARVLGAGTVGKLPKFTGTNTLGDSLLSESGTNITVNGNLTAPQGDLPSSVRNGPGVVFGATTGSRAESTLTGQAIGTGDYTLNFRFQVPRVNPSPTQYAGAFTAAASDRLTLGFDISGQLFTLFQKPSETTITTLHTGVTVASHGGQFIDVAVVRFGVTNALVYVNGALLSTGTISGPAVGNSFSATATHGTGNYGSDTALQSIITASRLFTRALSAADVLSLSLYGVSAADEWGTMTALYTQDTSSGVDGWSATRVTLTANVDGVGTPSTDNTLQITVDGTAAASHAATRNPTSMVAGKRYRLSASILIPTANALGDNVQIHTPKQQVISLFGKSDTWRTVSADFVSTGNTLYIYITQNGNAAWNGNGTDTVFLKDIVLTPIGALIDLDMGFGGGGTIPDRGPLGLNATLYGAYTHTRPVRSLYLDGGKLDINATPAVAGTHLIRAMDGAATNFLVRKDGAIASLYERFGTGSPEGVITAPVGTRYTRTDGGSGTVLYLKESGAGNTGWVASAATVNNVTLTNAAASFIATNTAANMVKMSPWLLTNGVVFVRTEGRTTPGVGGGLYRYDMASTETTNLGTRLAHETIGGRFIYAEEIPPSVDLFGAIPDFAGANNGNDLAAFTNALASLPAGSTLRLNRGTYRAVGITNNRAINLVGVKASRPSRQGTNVYIGAQGFGSEIEADGDGWIYTIEGRIGYAHNSNPNEEYQMQPCTTEGISFFGNGRTNDVGGMRLANVDRAIVRDVGAYAFRKSGIWAQRTLREADIHNIDIRYCGDADSTNSPDTVRGWPGLMIFDDSPTNSLVGDKHNFNVWDTVFVSFSLGCALIIDTTNNTEGVVFNERFRNMTLHGYKAGNSLFNSEYAASANKYTSPLAVIRASNGVEIRDSLFWFTGDNAPYISYEQNTNIGIGAKWASISGCTFYGNYNQTTETPAFITIDASSSVNVGQNLFRGTDGDTSRVRVADSSAIDLDRFFQAGRSVFRELVITNAP